MSFRMKAYQIRRMVAQPGRGAAFRGEQLACAMLPATGDGDQIIGGSRAVRRVCCRCPRVPRDEQFSAVKQLLQEGIIAHTELSEVSLDEIEAA